MSERRHEYTAQGDDLVRKMPCSLASERALLGSILIDPSSITDILTVVQADDFYVTEHKEIFLAMRELFDTSSEIDPVTLIDTLVHKGVYEKAGGEDYIRSLLDATPSAMNIKDYARIVKEESVRRRVIATCSEISDMTYGEQESITHILDFAQGQFTDIAAGRDSRTLSQYLFYGQVAPTDVRDRASHRKGCGYRRIRGEGKNARGGNRGGVL